MASRRKGYRSDGYRMECDCRGPEKGYGIVDLVIRMAPSERASVFSRMWCGMVFWNGQWSADDGSCRRKKEEVSSVHVLFD